MQAWPRYASRSLPLRVACWRAILSPAVHGLAGCSRNDQLTPVLRIMVITPAERCEYLRAEIERHNVQYYQLDEPLISDAEFDALFRELQNLEAQHPELSTPDSPTHRVGSKPLKVFAEVVHRTPMLSLNNAFSDEEVLAFDERVRE